MPINKPLPETYYSLSWSYVFCCLSCVTLQLKQQKKQRQDLQRPPFPLWTSEGTRFSHRLAFLLRPHTLRQFIFLFLSWAPDTPHVTVLEQLSNKYYAHNFAVVDKDMQIKIIYICIYMLLYKYTYNCHSSFSSLFFLFKIFLKK